MAASALLRRGVAAAAAAVASGFLATSFACEAPSQRRVALAWGANSQGQLGLGSEKDEGVPARVSLPGNVDTVISSSTADSSAALADGRLFVWGCGRGGRIGLGGGDHNALVPSELRLPPLHAGTRVVSAALSEQFGLALLETGEVLSWGKRALGREAKGEAAALPGRVQFPSGAGAPPLIVAIAAGREHALAIDAEGGVWSWGVGSSYALGQGDKADAPLPKRVPLPPGVRALAVAAGRDHSLVLVAESGSGSGSDGGAAGGQAAAAGGRAAAACAAAGAVPTAVYAFGMDDFGQCGGGFTERRWASPQRVQGLPPASLAGHSGAGASAGGGAGGSGGASGLCPPGTVCSAAVGAQVCGIAAGEAFSGALTRDGRVLTWGQGNSGQLAHGDKADSGRPRLVDPARFSRLGGTPVSIAAGGAHLLVRLSNGSLAAVGKGRNGQLGRGGDIHDSVAGNRLDPVLVTSLPGPVAAVAAGREHSLAVVSLPAGQE